MNSKPTGTLEDWRKFINLLIRKKLWDHLAIILMGAGSPLMRFTGLHGLTIHCASTESGTGKSLALDGAASIWGHPIHYRTGAGTSPVAMQQRLGLLHSNALITDEITSKNREDFEWFPAFLLSMSEGRGKERMESGANKERLNLSIWQTIAIMSSNRPAVDYMTGARQHSSEGELRRLIEYGMDEKLDWNTEEIEVIKSLQNNYAVVGDVLVRYFVSNVDYLKTLLPKTIRQMYDEFNAPNDERFWMAGLGASICALKAFKELGVADIPYRHILNSYKRAVDYMRASMKSSVRTAVDVLNAYTRENYGFFVVIKPSKGGLMAELGSGKDIDLSITRNKVFGRVEHEPIPNHIDYFIEEQLLKAYCATMSFGYATFKRQLEQLYNVEYLKKDMMAKTKGPQMRVSVMKIRREIVEADEILLTAPSVGES